VGRQPTPDRAAPPGAISTLIDTDVREVPPIIMDLGVDEAVKAWHNVAVNADAYRVNAHVRQATGALRTGSSRSSTNAGSAPTCSPG
jgi:hypothetical protein